jgi:hypothetical protein
MNNELEGIWRNVCGLISGTVMAFGGRVLRKTVYNLRQESGVSCPRFESGAFQI